MHQLAPSAQAAVVRARMEAELWNHAAIEPRHLLIGILRESPEAVAWLRMRGLDPAALQAEVERDLAPGPRPERETLRFEGGARRVFERAAEAARIAGQATVEAVRLLEALLSEGAVAVAARGCGGSGRGA